MPRYTIKGIYEIEPPASLLPLHGPYEPYRIKSYFPSQCNFALNDEGEPINMIGQEYPIIAQSAAHAVHDFFHGGPRRYAQSSSATEVPYPPGMYLPLLLNHIYAVVIKNIQNKLNVYFIMPSMPNTTSTMTSGKVVDPADATGITATTLTLLKQHTTVADALVKNRKLSIASINEQGSLPEELRSVLESDAATHNQNLRKQIEATELKLQEQRREEARQAELAAMHPIQRRIILAEELIKGGQ